METVDFPESNFTFTRPSNMTPEQCKDLRVFKGECSDGQKVSISCFKATEEELEEIKKTGLVWLYVLGEGHPPVAINGVSPWKE